MKVKQFNKKNLLEFADYLYKEKNGRIHYQPLCSGNIAAEKDGSVVCCILGELYEYFIGSVYLESNQGICPILNEYNIARFLTKISTVKEKDYFALTAEIEGLVGENDYGYNGHDNQQDDVLIERAKKCSIACRKIAKKYLK